MKLQTMKRPLHSLHGEVSGDVRRQSRNLTPQYHPMQRAREYTRAVTAAKLDRMFAHPLVGNLGNGHMDAVTCSSLSRRALLPLVSGSADGMVKLWDLATRREMGAIAAHSKSVTGVVFALDGQSFYSCSEDGRMHQWSIQADQKPNVDGTPSHGPMASWRTNGSFKSMDHHWWKDEWATASSEAVQIWNPERTVAQQTHSQLWGSEDTVTVVRYNPAEHSLLGHCSADRGIGLHDTRTATALKKTVLRMRSNDFQWNPMEPMTFCVANEDYNCYTFDMRRLDAPTKIYKGHVSAVLSVSWAPTGQEFVSGSYDCTMRLFPLDKLTSRDIYHTRRMQKIFTVQYTLDNKYVLSGSDDTNLRLWKARASEKVGTLTPAETQAMQYRQALIQKYQHLPGVKEIHRSRKIPSYIKTQTRIGREHQQSQDRKHANRVKYAHNGEHKFVPERKKAVVRQVD
jgi:DDB1- and CUL4-associated factor 13